MKVIGITGPSGSGKTTISKIFKENYNAFIIDADQVARDLSNNTETEYFKEMVKLLGIKCIYRAPLPGKTFDMHGDLDAKYYPGEVVGVIFQDHPDQKTLKKMLKSLGIFPIFMRSLRLIIQ